jgi:hypothetical protein
MARKTKTKEADPAPAALNIIDMLDDPTLFQP